MFDYHAGDWVLQVRDVVPGSVDFPSTLLAAPTQLGEGVVGESLDADVNRQRLEAIGRLVEVCSPRPQVEAVLPLAAYPSAKS